VWAKSQSIGECLWRKPGVADYDAATDTWKVGPVTLHFAVETEEERYYCGRYEGELEPMPIVYWVAMDQAMLPQAGK
jgi:hypothetical protein